MQSDDLRILRIFYNRLRSVLEIDRPQNPHRSLLLPFFDMKSNARYRILSKAALETTSVSGTVIQELEEDGCVLPAEELDYFQITAKGIWTVETNEGILSIEELLKFLNLKYFTFGNTSMKLKDKEKIIILLFLSLRAFSAEACIDLIQNDTVLLSLQEVANRCFKKLSDLECITNLEEEDIFGKRGNEHPISNLIRHTDELPRKTKGMYSSLGMQKYFLDISDENGINSHKASYLISLLYDRKGNVTSLEELADFMECINRDYSLYVFSQSSSSFSSPIYNLPIRKAIEELIDN